jgi:hypothetical protein
VTSPLNLGIYHRSTDTENRIPAGDGAIQLDDIAPSIALFAKGLSGRYCAVDPLTKASNFLANPHRVFPFSNGRSIYLPVLLDVFPLYETNRRIIRLYAAVQAAQWELGTFDQPREADIRAIWQDEFKPAESDHLFWIRFFIGRFPHAGLAGDIFITLETARVVAALARQFQGFHADLKWFLSALAHPSKQVTHPHGILWNIFFDLFDCPCTIGAMKTHGLIVAAARPLVQSHAELKDALKATVTIYEMLAPMVGAASGEERLEFEDKPDAFLTNLPGRARSMSKQDGQMRQEGEGIYIFEKMTESIENLTFSKNRITHGPMNFMSEGLVTKLDEGSVAEKEPDGKHTPAAVHASDSPSPDVKPFYYPEWDYLARGYRRKWVRLHSFDKPPAGGSTGRPVLEGWETIIREVMRQFRMLSREDRVWRKRLLHGEEIEFDRMVEGEIDRRTGHIPSDKIYMDKRRRIREVSTFLLLDMSASTSFMIEEGEHKGNTVLTVLLAGAAVMAQVLEQLGDRYCIYGFSGYGKDNVELWCIKSYMAHLTDSTLLDMERMRAQRSTRTGAAVRHACHMLASEAAPLKLLLVLSDGYPQDYDYGDDRSDREYGLRDTARALVEAEMNGIIPFCISVDAAGHDYLRRMCSPHTYLVIKKIQDLPRELPKLYMRLRSQ